MDRIAWSCCGILTMLLLGSPAGAETPVTDQNYDAFLSTRADQAAEIAQAEKALAEDDEAEESFLAYQDSLAAHEILLEDEEAFQKYLSEDEELSSRLEAYEDAAAQDPDAAQELAAYDSLLASDEDLASSVQEVEVDLAADEEGLEEHQKALAYLDEHPEEASEFYAQEEGPAYSGDDRAIIAYVAYLRAHPKLYRGWYRVHRSLRAHPRVRGPVFKHWRWLRARPSLWRAELRYRLRVAHHAPLHKVHWARRIYWGHRPALARSIWRHRTFIASRPQVRARVRYLQRHPRVARQVVDHRRWVHNHSAPRPHPERAVKSVLASPKTVKKAPKRVPAKRAPEKPLRKPPKKH